MNENNLPQTMARWRAMLQGNHVRPDTVSHVWFEIVHVVFGDDELGRPANERVKAYHAWLETLPPETLAKLFSSPEDGGRDD